MSTFMVLFVLQGADDVLIKDITAPTPLVAHELALERLRETLILRHVAHRHDTEHLSFDDWDKAVIEEKARLARCSFMGKVKKVRDQIFTVAPTPVLTW